MKKQQIIKSASIPIKVFLISIFTLSGFSVHAQNASTNQPGKSFIILAGSKTTNDGSVLVAQNKGGPGRELAFLRKYPRQEHDSAEVIRLVNGLEVPQNNITLSWMGLQTKNGYEEGNAVAVNERQVSIAGTVSLRTDRNSKARRADPMVKGGVTREVFYLALQRARSARECVKLIGNFYDKYGIAHPYGVAVADKQEIWYLEAGGGHHWAAVRIPDDAFWVQANAYRIGHIDPDNRNTMASDGLLRFARENGLWDPESELFDFADAFGGRVSRLEDKVQYNSLRIWRATSLLDSSLRVTPNQEEYPLYIRPDDKVSISKIISILRDHYQGTPYNTFENDSLSDQAPPLASADVVHTSVLQLTNGLPPDVGAVLWAGFSSPLTTPYIPFYFGVKNVPKPYDAKTPDKQKAAQVYQRLADLFYQSPLKSSARFPSIWNDFQEKCFNEQVKIDQGAMRLYRMQASLARHFLTVNIESLSREALYIARDEADEYQ